MTDFCILYLNCMDYLNSSICDIVNMIILLGKYHIHCSKNSKPSFVWFRNDFKLFFFQLKKKKKN